MANAEQKSELGSKPSEKIQAHGPHDAETESERSHAIYLDRASEAEIAEIDMIGKKLAHAIVAQREASGGFQSWEDLKQVPGLDAMKIAELQRAARLSERA
jgi:competence ComEA-like helix-hairpin-helix protein